MYHRVQQPSPAETLAQRPLPSAVAALTGSEPFFDSDEYLRPGLEDDPLLRSSLHPLCDDVVPLTEDVDRDRA